MPRDVIHGKIARNGSNYVRLTEGEFNDLPNYSCSLPTGTTIGKRWKRREPYEDGPPGTVHLWYMGEYVEHPDPETVGIEWFLIELLTQREAQVLRLYPNGVDGAGRREDHRPKKETPVGT